MKLAVGVFIFSVILSTLPSWGSGLTSIPDTKAFLGWNEDAGGQSTKLDSVKVRKINLNCARADKLYPTHPDMGLKEYYNARWGRYDQRLLKGNDEACLISTKPSRPTAPKFCLAADILKYVIISDTYQDACGNLYRGFYEEMYFKSHDNMGTLFSKGRSLYPDPEAMFAGEMITSGTYPVEASEFLFLTPLFPEDAKKIEKARFRALQSGMKYDPQTFLFDEP